MSYRSWFFIFAIGLAVAVSSTAQSRPIQDHLGNQQPAQKATQSESGNQTAIDSTIVRKPTAPTKPTSKEHNGGHSENANSESGNNLLFGDGWAQWLMAITGLGALIVSAWAVWLLKKTLDVTIKAVSDTERATNATIKATTDQQRIGEAQVRAYITCSDATFEVTDMGISIKPKFHNSGTSPSSEISIAAYIKPADELFALAVGGQPSTEVPGVGNVPCINSGEAESGLIHWDEIKSVYDSDLGLGHFTVRGTASWKDVFGVWCEIDFKLAIKTAERDPESFNWIIYGGTMTATNQQFRVLEKDA